ncbi:hypothetical protein Hanom_Chr11g01038051 [Helianthus anomalus]
MSLNNIKFTTSMNLFHPFLIFILFFYIFLINFFLLFILIFLCSPTKIPDRF